MFLNVEVEQTHLSLRWMEISVRDSVNEGAAIIRIPVDDPPRMMADFLQRYMAKREQAFDAPASQTRQLEEFFEEAVMARVMLQKGNADHDLVSLFPTTLLNFTYPEKSSFRKSRSARVQLFLDEAIASLEKRQFADAMKRLEWVHHLIPQNELAFELKIVCLRSWKKFSECVPVFETWAVAWPKQAEPILGLGEMWLYLEQYQRAKDCFATLLALAPNHCQGLIGLAQAKLKLGEDPIPELRKARIVDGHTTYALIERGFDFRSRKPKNLKEATLQEVAEQWQIPLKRVIQRAESGALPCLAPEEGDDNGLLRFDEDDMATYRKVLEILGLEIRISPAPAVGEAPEKEASSSQLPADEPGTSTSAALEPQPPTEEGGAAASVAQDAALAGVADEKRRPIASGLSEPQVMQPGLFDE